MASDHGVAMSAISRALQKLRCVEATTPIGDSITSSSNEFQDLTETEARLTLGLCSAEAEVVALGDRKQSIYAFRGNEERGFDALPDLVGKPVTDHRMDECRRCPEEIVELANAVMDQYGEPLVDVGACA
jgi:hypothetical protein